MSRYFIDRPIFAWILAILVMLFGLLSVRSLPIAQFPALAPPQISITAIYPGADAATLSEASRDRSCTGRSACGERGPRLR